MCADENVIETDIYVEVNGASDVTLKLNEILFRISKLLSDDRKSLPKDNENAASVSAGSTSRMRVKLPKIDLEKFGGTLKGGFLGGSFDSVINQNDLSSVDKFNYLKTLLTGDALSAISGLSPSNENYKNAIEILTERFVKKVIVISSHMEAILKMQALSDGDSTKKLRRVVDKIETHWVFTSIGY